MGLKSCPYCGRVVREGDLVDHFVDFHAGEPDFADKLVRTAGVPSASQKKRQPVGKVSETQCTCQTCGRVWHYGKVEQMEAAGAALSNCGKSMMCCSGCGPAALIRNEEVPDLNRCPTCGSRRITKRQITHDV